MHVAINGWFWDQPYTGSGQYVRHLVKALAQLSADLTLTLIIPNHIKSLEDVPASVKVVRASTVFPGNLGKVWFEQRSFPAAAASADIAHVPYWGSPLSSKARLVVSILDVIPLLFVEYRGSTLAQLYTSLVAAGAKGAGHILTLSEASKADIVQHLGIPADQVTPTLLAADERFTHVPDPVRDEAVRQKYDLPDEFALYFGGFDVRKNVRTLLQAWTYVGKGVGVQIPLVLAGRQPSQWGTPLFPDLPQYARELNLDEKVLFLGEVAEADKPSLYRLAKVMIWTSLYEGFGLPPLEAMASGTPVVAVNASSTPEVVGDAAYLIDPHDAREMGGAILAVLVQDDFHRGLANTGRGQATKFSWRKTAQETYAVYEKIMRQG